MTPRSQLLRVSPQLATIELLSSTIGTVVASLRAAHPTLELDPTRRFAAVPRLPIDVLAARVIGASEPLLLAVHDYQRLLDDLTRLECGALPEGSDLAMF